MIEDLVFEHDYTYSAFFVYNMPYSALLNELKTKLKIGEGQIIWL